MIDSRRHELKANMQIARCLLENGDIDALPDEDDLQHSLDFLEGVVCQNEAIFDFDVVTSPNFRDITSASKKPIG